MGLLPISLVERLEDLPVYSTTNQIAHAASQPTLAKNARMGHPQWERCPQRSSKAGHPFLRKNHKVAEWANFQNFLDDLSNSGPAVRPYREGRTPAALI